MVSRDDYGAGPCAECLFPARQPAAVRSPGGILAAQTRLEAAEMVELQATGAPLKDEQLARVHTERRAAVSFCGSEVLTQAGSDGIRALAHAACTARVCPDLPVATIGLVATLPGLLPVAELVKEAVVGVPSCQSRIGRS